MSDGAAALIIMGAGIGGYAIYRHWKREKDREERSRVGAYRGTFVGQGPPEGIDMTIISALGAPVSLLRKSPFQDQRFWSTDYGYVGWVTETIPRGTIVKAVPLYASRVDGSFVYSPFAPEAVGIRTDTGSTRAGWAVKWDAPGLPGEWWRVGSADVATTESVKQARALSESPPPRPAIRVPQARTGYFEYPGEDVTGLYPWSHAHR